MGKIKVGDLARIRDLDHNGYGFSSKQYSFRIVGEETQYVECRELEGKTGIVVFNVQEDCKDYLADGVYHIAFGDIVIRAYQDYFCKVEKTLNKINN
jgi:hypothetical protein